MRGPLLALAAGLFFLSLTAVLAGRFYSAMPGEAEGPFWGPVLFILLGAAGLIGFFLWLRRRH